MLFLIQVDALRHDYLEGAGPEVPAGGAPLVKGRLQPIFGFEPDAAYLAGEFPEDSDGGAHFWHEPEGSPFKALRFLPRQLDGLPELPAKAMRRILDRTLRRIHRIPALTTARIPVRELSAFGFPKKVGFGEPGFTTTPSIFDHLRQQGKAFLRHVCPEHSVNIEDVVERVRRDLRPEMEFCFLHVGNLDRIGHKFGPDSSELKAEVAKVMDGLAEAMRIAESRVGQANWVIFGDHGMSQVTRHIDVAGALRDLSAKPGKDYRVFLDSTMARFWFFNDAARKQVTKALHDLDAGRILEPADMEHYRLHWGHNRFGDLIFVVRQNSLILPNYFQGHRAIQGMHGYLPEEPDQQSVYTIFGPAVTAHRVDKEPQDMRRMFPTSMKLLGFGEETWKGIEPLV